eukprot:1817538-Amphidinium_carterae.1
MHRWLLRSAEKAKVEKAMTTAETTTTTTTTTTSTSASSTTKPAKAVTPAKGGRPKSLGQVQSELKRSKAQPAKDAKRQKVATPSSLEEQVDDLFFG